MQKGHPKVAEDVANGQSCPQDISSADVCWGTSEFAVEKGTVEKGTDLFFSTL